MRSPARFVLGAVCVFSLVGCPAEEEPAPPPPPAPRPRPAPAIDAGGAEAGPAATDGGPIAATDGGAPDGGGADADAGPAALAWADVSTKPAGALVTLDGVDGGKTPARVQLAAGRKQALVVALPGYFPETRELEPGADETVPLKLTLRPAASLRVTTEPPGASVTVNGEVVLPATPGVTAPFKPGKAEVAIALPGYDTFTKKLTVKGEQKLDAKLVAATKVHVTSKPSEATVTLDGKAMGVTPLDVWVSPKGKATIVVTKEGWSTFKKVLVKPPADLEPLEVTLTELEMDRLEAAVAKAQKAHDDANNALEKLQERAQDNPGLEDKVTAAEAVMEQATEALDEAEKALAAAKKERGIK